MFVKYCKHYRTTVGTRLILTVLSRLSKRNNYYYITPTVVGWCIAILRFFFTIIILILIIINILPHIFVRSISRRCHDQTLWNLVGISYAMWSCACKGWFFQNGYRCHGNGQNANKQLRQERMIRPSSTFIQYL